MFIMGFVVWGFGFGVWLVGSGVGKVGCGAGNRVGMGTHLGLEFRAPSQPRRGILTLGPPPLSRLAPAWPVACGSEALNPINPRSRNPKLGMFPLILTVLNGDFRTP